MGGEQTMSMSFYLGQAIETLIDEVPPVTSGDHTSGGDVASDAYIEWATRVDLLPVTLEQPLCDALAQRIAPTWALAATDRVAARAELVAILRGLRKAIDDGTLPHRATTHDSFLAHRRHREFIPRSVAEAENEDEMELTLSVKDDGTLSNQDGDEYDEAGKVGEGATDLDQKGRVVTLRLVATEIEHADYYYEVLSKCLDDGIFISGDVDDIVEAFADEELERLAAARGKARRESSDA